MSSSGVVIAFRAAQISLIAIFGYLISDAGRKPGMKPLMSTWRIVALRLLYLVPLGAYAYEISAESHLLASDFAALALSLLGTLVVSKGKRDLGQHHTWSGYYLEGPSLCTRGIYAYIRHPMYTGIFVFILATLVAVIPEASPVLAGAALLAATYVVAHLARAAGLETGRLRQSLGDEADRYVREVHPFLPIHKYRP